MRMRYSLICFSQSGFPGFSFVGEIVGSNLGFLGGEGLRLGGDEYLNLSPGCGYTNPEGRGVAEPNTGDSAIGLSG